MELEFWLGIEIRICDSVSYRIEFHVLVLIQSLLLDFSVLGMAFGWARTALTGLDN